MVHLLYHTGTTTNHLVDMTTEAVVQTWIATPLVVSTTLLAVIASTTLPTEIVSTTTREVDIETISNMATTDLGKINLVPQSVTEVVLQTDYPTEVATQTNCCSCLQLQHKTHPVRA